MIRDLLAVGEASGCCHASKFSGTADTVVPALYGIQQEPTWPCIMGDHQPDDWPNSMLPTPTDRYQDLMYLLRQDVLSMETSQAISSFYHFMLVSLTLQNWLQLSRLPRCK